MKDLGSVKEKVQVWIYSRVGPETKVLILKVRPIRGGFWQPVTGHVEPGESLAQAALRECEEETGLHFASKPFPLNYVFEFQGRFGPARETAFAIQTPTELPSIVMDPKEHQDYAWVSVSEAETRLKFESNKEALQLLKKKF